LMSALAESNWSLIFLMKSFLSRSLMRGANWMVGLCTTIFGSEAVALVSRFDSPAAVGGFGLGQLEGSGILSFRSVDVAAGLGKVSTTETGVEVAWFSASGEGS
jgi:hypothetical protein